MSRPVFTRRLLAPRYWLTWAGFGLWWLISQGPFSLLCGLGRILGAMIPWMAPRRMAIAARNIALCYPTLSESERKNLLKSHAQSLGIGFFEVGMAWFWPGWRLRRLVSYQGLEHLGAARARGQGVLLMGMHFTHLDLSAMFVSLECSIDGSYRQHANPVYDWIQHRCRERFNPGNIAIERGDVRTMVRQLKKGRAIWYAPDQDYGAKHSIFVPFMGVNAATITATGQLARLGQAAVIPFSCVRHRQGYRLSVQPPLIDYPSGQEEVDALRINQVVEAAIAQAPDQYLWVHRRFKTRPNGEPDLYEAAGIAKGKRQ